ncbi:Maf family protein [Dasania sp. GY-MA-18]|uniref:dTTP/UTP pyrophosphatase n=1 Tax=Dasania phycosphaerae TaxID=2950436 RepID=A0A9J6RHU3_9GAMM|nr:MULTISPECIES: Maf family protein [Dasania]MCR8921584.1 Maf family protein [Dasania sp. GY-MA-18]MCZ0864012.1 Maf family protein [Dasania phycosphaerae]MCZ0867740.1 Maf family protein [Dasania phycosphaerae]
MSTNIQCILASQSPRRAELLKQIQVDFIVQAADVDESVLPHETPAAYVQRLSIAKAEAVWQQRSEQQLPALPVLGSDTSVVIDQHILGKPANRDEARQMLQLLSGREHQVLSSVSVIYQQQQLSALSTTQVSFRAISPAELERYIASDEPYDKAGGYAIQGFAAVFIQQIQGSYSGVMGLPLQETYQLLQAILTDKSS